METVKLIKHHKPYINPPVGGSGFGLWFVETVRKTCEKMGVWKTAVCDGKLRFVRKTHVKKRWVRFGFVMNGSLFGKLNSEELVPVCDGCVRVPVRSVCEKTVRKTCEKMGEWQSVWKTLVKKWVRCGCRQEKMREWVCQGGRVGVGVWQSVWKTLVKKWVRFGCRQENSQWEETGPGLGAVRKTLSGRKTGPGL
jgi:hypothetical protein